MIVEIITIFSTSSAACAAVVKLYHAVRSNKYAADYSRIYTLNQHERGKFSEIVIPPRKPVVGHTHGESAARRSAGSSAAAAYAYSIGRVPFYLSMSASDQRAGRQGERTMHWSKDFNAERRKMEPGVDSALVLIDVDEHIDDLPQMLHDKNLPAILYTFQPSAASGVFGDYRYTFDKDNKVVYDVAGGGHYHHEVWDYSPDCVTLRKKFLGLTYAKSFFSVEKRYIDENHQLVLLTPLARFGLLGCILSFNVSGVDLQRLRPVKDGFVRLAVARSEVDGTEYGHKISTSKIGMYNSATITMEQDNALALAAVNSESKLSPFQVKSMIPGISNESATTLVDFHRLKKNNDVARVVVPTDAVNNYTYNPTFTMEEKPSVTPFMAPILPDAYAPTQSVQNDEAMVKGRITDLAKDPKPLDEKELKYAKEFAELLLKEIGKLTPVGHEEIVEKLNRPSQRKITDEAAFAAKVETTIKSFMKKEAYQKPTDPRPIATINGKDKYEYSSYTYAVSEALKRTSWYAFGRKPKGISERVAEVCMAAMHVVLTDLSRFDGRVNLSLRQLEEIVMKALFEEKYWPDMLRLMKRQHSGKGITRLGVKYRNGMNRQSGSPETAIFNSICNAFMAYVTYREAGCEPAEAYRKLGVYGGDDGLTADVDPVLYTQVAARFGHVLEAERIKRGDPGVSFLARFYSPMVWVGDINSCADIARALCKFHTATTSDVTPVDKLFEKAYALSLTDSNTPIIGTFVNRVVELSGKGAEDYKNVLNIWNSTVEEENQYPNDDTDGWMSALVKVQGLEGFRIKDMDKWLADCKTLEDCLKLPAFIDKPEIKLAKVPVKMNDDLLPSQDEMDRMINDYKRKRKSGDAPVINPFPKFHPDPLDVKQPSNNKMDLNLNRKPSGAPGRSSTAVPIKPGKSGKSTAKPAGRPNDGRDRGQGGHIPNSSGSSDTQSTGRNRGKSQSDKSSVGKRQIWKPVFHCDPTVVGNQCERLNGNNGSATNTDDHSPRETVRNWRDDFPTEAKEAGFFQNLAGDAFDRGLDYLESVAPESDQGLSRAISGYVDVAGEYFTSVGDSIANTVYRYTDPIVDVFADTPHPQRPWESVPIPPPLVGVELNPGPVTLPIKGPRISTKMRKLAAETRAAKNAAKAVVRAEKRMMKPRISYPRPTPPQGSIANARKFVAAAYATGNRVGKPIIIHNGDDSVTIKHRELISKVVGTTNFSTTSISINPGLASILPWLATQALGWEKYRFNALRAQYLTRTGSQTTGTFMMIPDYDAADSPPLSDTDASSFHGATDDSPWVDQELNFDMNRSRELFIRQGPLSANLDIKTYDFANLYLATTDGTAVNWGKVYLEYNITFYNSQVLAQPGQGGSAQSTTGNSAALPFNPANTVITPGAYLQSVVNSSGSLFTFTNLKLGGEYQLFVQVSGSSVTAVNSTGTMVGFTLKTNLLNDAVSGSSCTDLVTLTATATTATILVTATASSVTTSNLTFTVLQPTNSF